MPELMKYYDYEPSMSVTCPKCAWSGTAGETEDLAGDRLEVRCAECDTRLLGILFPTLDDAREAAASGNQRAIADLPQIEEQAVTRTRKMAKLLKQPEQLPDLTSDSVTIEWSCVDDADGEAWQVLSHAGKEIWREPAFYDCIERFEQVFEILRNRYSTRFTGLLPVGDSVHWLYGDSLSAPSRVEKLNRSVGNPRTADGGS